MNMNTKEVRFGTKQEAVITPKEGYELDRVDVINTVDNSVVPSEVRKTSDNPAQWICEFIQPAGHIIIKPYVRPILYSISFEMSEECTVVLVEEDSVADVELKAAIAGEEETSNEGEEPAEEPEDFNQPQHSLNKDAEQGLNVGDKESETNNINETYTAAADSSVDERVNENEQTSHITASESDQENAGTENDEGTTVESDKNENHDVEFDAGDYSEELDEIEPVVMSQEEYNKKNEIFWQWKQEFDAGRCSLEKFSDIKRRHLELMDAIGTGRIIIK